MANVRALAVNSVIKCEKQGRYSNLEVNSAIEKYKLEGLDRSFYSILVYGTVEKEIAIDYYLSQLSSIPLEELDTFVLGILRVAAYQILYLDRTPDFAVVNEAVEDAKKRCKAASAGYVNGVLRSLIRIKDELPTPTDINQALSVKYSLPQWLCELIIKDYDYKTGCGIMEGLNRHASLTLRTNILKNSRDEFLSELTERGIKCHASDNCRYGVVVDEAVESSRIPFDEGLCYAQDLSSQIMTEDIAPKSGELVIDVCSAPGGKSFSCGMLMENKGEIYSFDLHKNKLSLIINQAKKLGIDIIRVAECDGSVGDGTLDGAADKVICDVPCSGIGVIAKKPDLRYKKKEDIDNLPSVQAKILARSADYVKNGGELIYSTCTIAKAENERVVEDFLAQRSDFSLIRQRQFLPCDNWDGFYYAVMKKNI